MSNNNEKLVKDIRRLVYRKQRLLSIIVGPYV